MTMARSAQAGPTGVVDRFLAGIEAGDLPQGLFADDAGLDATVPNWRFRVEGGEAVRAELARWYADPGRFLELHRTPLPDGELVEFALGWDEDGVPHRAHQAHIVRVADDRILADTAFCGGRWPADLIAQMEEAQAASA
jgi:hypothetical protein